MARTHANDDRLENQFVQFVLRERKHPAKCRGGNVGEGFGSRSFYHPAIYVFKARPERKIL
jgi:hypothetical protein